MPSVSEHKAALRRRMALLRDLIDDRVLRSVQLWGQLAELPQYATARTVMAYSSIHGEPDTDGLHARLHHDGKVLALPRMVSGSIEPALLGDGFRRGHLGIAEPTGAAVDPASIDLIVVPGVAFTLDGRRLGRGGGHYDRFLATLTCATVGACFAEQIVDDLPTEPHDVRVGAVLAG